MDLSGVPARVGALDTVVSTGMEVGMGWSVGTTGEVCSGEEMLQLVFCCSTRDETAGLDLGEQRDGRKSVIRLPGFLLGVQYLLIAT